MKLGGSELQSPSDTASSAYISLSISCYDLINALLEPKPDIVLYQEAVTDWRAKVSPDKRPPLEGHRQKS